MINYKQMHSVQMIKRSKTMDKKKIERINELYHKMKAEGLTPAEKEEQQKLRKEYIMAIRKNLRGTLENVSILEKDGTVTPVKRKKLS